MLSSRFLFKMVSLGLPRPSKAKQAGTQGPVNGTGEQLAVKRVRVAGPEDLSICPISQMPAEDPVVDEFGHTYDRLCIELWVSYSNKPRSPLTNKPYSLPLKLTRQVTSRHKFQSFDIESLSADQKAKVLQLSDPIIKQIGRNISVEMATSFGSKSIDESIGKFAKQYKQKYQNVSNYFTDSWVNVRVARFLERHISAYITSVESELNEKLATYLKATGHHSDVQLATDIRAYTNKKLSELIKQKWAPHKSRIISGVVTKIKR